MKRKIVRIDKSKCTGCGQCATACAEGAIKIVDGKAVFVVAEKGLEHCRIFSEGRTNHFYEIMETQKQAFANLANIKAGCEKYRNHPIAVLKSEAGMKPQVEEIEPAPTH